MHWGASCAQKDKHIHRETEQEDKKTPKAQESGRKYIITQEEPHHLQGYEASIKQQEKVSMITTNIIIWSPDYNNFFAIFS